MNSTIAAAHQEAPRPARLHRSLTESIGSTPLHELQRLARGLPGRIAGEKEALVGIAEQGR
jgi:hypothetical protein